MDAGVSQYSSTPKEEGNLLQFRVGKKTAGVIGLTTVYSTNTCVHDLYDSPKKTSGLYGGEQCWTLPAYPQQASVQYAVWFKTVVLFDDLHKDTLNFNNSFKKKLSKLEGKVKLYCMESNTEWMSAEAV